MSLPTATSWRSVLLAATVGVAAMLLQVQAAHSADAAAEVEKLAQARDPVVLSFATVGDSRQDPVTSDPTTLPLSGQDALWLQNTKAFTRILREIEARNPHFL